MLCIINYLLVENQEKHMYFTDSDTTSQSYFHL